MKVLPALGGFVLFIALFSSTAFATVSTTNTTCISSSLSELNLTIGVVSNGVQNTTTTSQAAYCNFGCNFKTGTCNSSTGDNATTQIPVTVAGIGLGGALVWLGATWQMKRPWDILYRILFIFFGLFAMVGVFTITGSFFSQAIGIPQSMIDIVTNNIVNFSWLIWIILGVLIMSIILEMAIAIHDIVMQRKQKEATERGE